MFSESKVVAKYGIALGHRLESSIGLGDSSLRGRRRNGQRRRDLVDGHVLETAQKPGSLQSFGQPLPDRARVAEGLAGDRIGMRLGALRVLVLHAGRRLAPPAFGESEADRNGGEPRAEPGGIATQRHPAVSDKRCGRREHLLQEVVELGAEADMGSENSAHETPVLEVELLPSLPIKSLQPRRKPRRIRGLVETAVCDLSVRWGHPRGPGASHAVICRGQLRLAQFFSEGRCRVPYEVGKVRREPLSGWRRATRGVSRPALRVELGVRGIR